MEAIPEDTEVEVIRIQVRMVRRSEETLGVEVMEVGILSREVTVAAAAEEEDTEEEVDLSRVVMEEGEEVMEVAIPTREVMEAVEEEVVVEVMEVPLEVVIPIPLLTVEEVRPSVVDTLHHPEAEEAAMVDLLVTLRNNLQIVKKFDVSLIN